MSYQNPPIINEDDTGAPLVAIILPLTTTTTMDHRSKRKMVAIVVAGMMLLVAGGAVWMQVGSSYDPSSGESLNVKDGSITTAAEGLVVASQATPCLPAQGIFNGISIRY